MDLAGLRRLSIADLTDEALAALIASGEHNLVERKQALPTPPKFGAAVASFANSGGGWLLLGVDDDGNAVGYPRAAELDVQSHLAAVLKKEVDPLPAFVAVSRKVNGQDIVVMRIFESSDTPHVVKGTGAVYMRTAKGKEPVEGQEALLSIASRGRDSRADAEERLWSLPLVATHIGTPEADSFSPNSEELLVIVRAAPLTVGPAFTDWGVTSQAADAASAALADVLPGESGQPFGPSDEVEPHGQGVVARRTGGGIHEKRTATFVIDSGGVIAGMLTIPSVGGPVVLLASLAEMVQALLGPVCALLQQGEAYGRVVADLWVAVPEGAYIHGAPRAPKPKTHCSGEATIPAVEDVERLTAAWMREFSRGVGIPDWG